MQFDIVHSRQNRLVACVVTLLIAMATVAMFGSALIKIIVLPLLFLIILMVAFFKRERTSIREKRGGIVFIIIIGWLTWTILCLVFLLARNSSGYPLALMFFGLGSFLASFMAVRLT